MAFTEIRWPLFVLLVLVNFFISTFPALQRIFPRAAKRKGLTSTDSLLFDSLLSLVEVVMSSLCGEFMNQLGAKIVLIIGVILPGASYILFEEMDQIQDCDWYTALSFISPIIVAIGRAALATGTFTLISCKFPKSSTTAFASLESFRTLGGIGLRFVSLLISAAPSAEQSGGSQSPKNVSICGLGQQNFSDNPFFPEFGGGTRPVGPYVVTPLQPIERNLRIAHKIIEVYPFPFLYNGGVLVFLAFVLVVLFVIAKSTSDKNTDEQTPEGCLTKRIYRILAVRLAAFIIMLGYSSFVFLEITLANYVKQLELKHSGWVLLVCGISYAIAAPLIGRFCDKNGQPKYVMSFGIALLIASLFLIGLASYIPHVPEINLKMSKHQFTISYILQMVFYFKNKISSRTFCLILGLIMYGIALAAVLDSGFVMVRFHAKENGFPDDFSTYGVASGVWNSSASLGSIVGTLGGALQKYAFFQNGSVYVIYAAVLLVVLIWISPCINCSKSSRETNNDVESE